jgi:broad specificity phosphatase PhoE
MKITLIRHAEVEERYKGCYNGHIDISLSSNGHIQAQKLAQKFQHEKFDAIFCSDLKRAKQTLKHFSQHKENVVYTDKLREKSWGKHEGMSFDEIISHGEIEYKNFLQWIKALDGESFDTFRKKIEKFFLTYLPMQNKNNILIVTHAGVIKTLTSILEGTTLEDSFNSKLDYAQYYVYTI